MIKIISLIVICFMLTGCSLIPRLTFDTKNTVPQSLNTSKGKVVCQGEAKFNEQGEMVYCSKGFYDYSENYAKQERKMTISERIKSFINGLVGWSFWGIVILLFLCPSLLGLIVGRLFEGVYGMGAKAFKQVSSAIQKVKSDSPNLIDALEKSTDSDVRAWIDDFKKKNSIK